MQYSDDRILTTHVGSLPRPDALLPYHEQRAAGESIDETAFDEAVADATETVVQRQADAGIDIATHGEMGRPSFVTYATNRLTGFDGELPAIQWADLEEYPDYARQVPTFREWSDPNATIPAATGPIEYQGEAATKHELDQFNDALKATGADFEETFVTAASPGTVCSYIGNDYYDTHHDYLDAVADAIQTEYELIADSGATLQIDAPDLLGGRHLKFKDYTDEEFLDIVDAHIDALNDALTNVPADRVRMHVCWGNYEGPHHHDIPLEKVLPHLYDADIGGLLLEHANPSHQHDHHVLDTHSIPDDWVIIPGVIDVTVNYIEPPGVIADRIERVVDAVGDPTRVLAGADCGLGTFAGFGAVNPDIAWQKLDALADGAAEATDRVF